LKPSGFFAISTPNPFWWKTWLIVLLKGNAMPHKQHTCWFCECTLKQLLIREGFAVREVNYDTVYDLTSILHRITKYINFFIPLPDRFKHNTLFVLAYIDTNIR